MSTMRSHRRLKSASWRQRVPADMWSGNLGRFGSLGPAIDYRSPYALRAPQFPVRFGLRSTLSCVPLSILMIPAT